MNKKQKHFFSSSKMKIVIFGVAILVFFFSIKTFNESREKGLNDVIPYKSKDFASLLFTKDRNNLGKNQGYEWRSEDHETIRELMSFLSQYRVKRISEEAFNEQPNYMQFEFVISHNKAKSTILLVFEKTVFVILGNFYEVVNGPMDMEWIELFHEKNLNKYKEIKS